jgi:2-dehydro-3-deoxygluconokinase
MAPLLQQGRMPFFWQQANAGSRYKDVAHQKSGWTGMKVATIGECMVELASAGNGSYALNFGGDTLNTATYLARLGIQTSYLTAVGDDPYSDAMLARWREAGIDCAQVRRLPGRMPGLYLIERDSTGDRQFFYWRDRAPAREMMEHMDDTLFHALLGCDWLYFSGITLSLYGEGGRAKFCSLLARLQATGVRLAFDGNYRPRGWESSGAARTAFEAILPMMDLALPTFDDERMVFGDTDSEACAARLRGRGVKEVVVKEGAKGVFVSSAPFTGWIAPPAPLEPVDTTAAGDSFNAGYLAGRLKGLNPDASARAGHLLAGAVIMRRGAVIAAEAMPTIDWQSLKEGTA